MRHHEVGEIHGLCAEWADERGSSLGAFLSLLKCLECVSNVLKTHCHRRPA